MTKGLPICARWVVALFAVGLIVFLLVLSSGSEVGGTLRAFRPSPPVHGSHLLTVSDCGSWSSLLDGFPPTMSMCRVSGSMITELLPKQGARPNDKERGDHGASMQASRARSSSSVSFAFGGASFHADDFGQDFQDSLVGLITLCSSCSTSSSCLSIRGQWHGWWSPRVRGALAGSF